MGGKFYAGAMVGAVSGAIGFVASELVGPYMKAVRKAISELQKDGLGTEMGGAKDAFDENDRGLNFSNNYVGRKLIDHGQYEAAQQIYYRMIESLSPETKFWTTFNLAHEGFKIGSYHFEEIGGYHYVHFEWDIMTHFLTHAIFESWRP
jgi:hypothetical protein